MHEPTKPCGCAHSRATGFIFSRPERETTPRGRFTEANTVSDTLYSIPEFHEVLKLVGSLVADGFDNASRTESEHRAARHERIERIVTALRRGRASGVREALDEGISFTGLLSDAARIEDAARRFTSKAPMTFATLDQEERKAGIRMAVERSGIVDRLVMRVVDGAGQDPSSCPMPCKVILGVGVLDIIIAVISIVLFDVWLAMDMGTNKEDIALLVVFELILVAVVAVNLDFNYTSCCGG